MAELISRKDYLSQPGWIAHRAYYAQFVTSAHFRRAERIGIGAIISSTDLYFNDIPLEKWDQNAVPVPAESARLLRACGDYPTLAGAVCILKEAARQIREKNAAT